MLLTPNALIAAPEFFILGDLDKPDGSQQLDNSKHYFDGEAITLFGARDEVVAFQVVLRAGRREDGLQARLDSLTHESAESAPTLRSPREIRPYLAHYVSTRDAGYTWGPGGAGALPWRGVKWPDALVPFFDPYDPAHPAVIEQFEIDPGGHRNQLVWFDVFIPRESPPGLYRGVLALEQHGEPFATLPVRLEVLDWALPAEPSVDAWTEVYRETGVMFDSGVKFKENPERDWHFYKRYVQMGHAHRILITHRAENGPLPLTPEGQPAAHWSDKWGDDWSMYLPYTLPILNGSLFTEAEGYVGPRAETGPKIFPAPFCEAFYGASDLLKYLEQHGGELPGELLETWKANAKKLIDQIIVEHRLDVQFFGYIFDEVDGITDDATSDVKLEAIHDAFTVTTAALYNLAYPIRPIWTTHRSSDQWPELNMDVVWSPNAHALSPDHAATMKGESVHWDFDDGAVWTPGDMLWFYHSGHPAIGNHTINQLGIDMALWGLMPARYPVVDGAFMWSSMNFPERWDKAGFNPYDNPSYRADDTRWGNGTLIYPGGRLTLIGASRNIEGPIPGMRLKAWRSGLQMAEYVARARNSMRNKAFLTGLQLKEYIEQTQNTPGFVSVDDELKQLIPAGFAEAGKSGRGQWSANPSDYYAFREQLAGAED